MVSHIMRRAKKKIGKKEEVILKILKDEIWKLNMHITKKKCFKECEREISS